MVTRNIALFAARQLPKEPAAAAILIQNTAAVVTALQAAILVKTAALPDTAAAVTALQAAILVDTAAPPGTAAETQMQEGKDLPIRTVIIQEDR